MHLGLDVESNDRIELSAEIRDAGFYLIGRRGMGKSTLMEALIASQINAGEGVGVLDPHGNLIDAIMDRVPDNRLDDVVLLDASDRDYPFGLNLFEVQEDGDLSRAVEQVVQTFKKVWGVGEDASWGPLLEDLLANVTHTLIESGDYTLAEVPALLYKPKFRQSLVDQLGSWVVQDFWRYDWDPLSNVQQIRDRRSTTNKVRAFLRDEVIANIVGQVRSTINLRSIMEERKILLVRLEHGDIGETAASLLGSLLIGRILSAALSREASPETPMFYLYADEFQRFATPAFATLIDETRKYRVATTIAHQRRSQLDHAYQEMARGAVNYVIFQVNGDDAEEFAGEFKIETQPGELIARPRMEPVYEKQKETYWNPPEAQYEVLTIENRLREIEQERRQAGRSPEAETLQEMQAAIRWFYPLKTYESQDGYLGPEFSRMGRDCELQMIQQVRERGICAQTGTSWNKWLGRGEAQQIVELDTGSGKEQGVVLCSLLAREDDQEHRELFTFQVNVEHENLPRRYQRSFEEGRESMPASTSQWLETLDRDMRQVLDREDACRAKVCEFVVKNLISLFVVDVGGQERLWAEGINHIRYMMRFNTLLSHHAVFTDWQYPESLQFLKQIKDGLRNEKENLLAHLLEEERQLKARLKELVKHKRTRITSRHLYDRQVKRVTGVDQWGNDIEEVEYEYVPGGDRAIADIRNELVSTLANLPPYQAYLRFGSGHELIQRHIKLPIVYPTPPDEERRQHIKEHSRAHYAQPRTLVQEQIRRRQAALETEPNEPEPPITQAPRKLRTR